MITRFRVEGVGQDRDELIEEMSMAVGAIAKALRTEGNGNGHWECTDDNIHAEREVQSINPSREPAKLTGIYKGRMVMVYRSNGNGS